MFNFDSLEKQLMGFGLGQHLLKHGSLDAYWTRYITVEYPRIMNSGSELNQTDLESFFLDRFPWCLAMRDRYSIFCAQIRKYIHDGIDVASIPCGYMDVLLSLDYSSFNDVHLYGIDRSMGALDGAKGLVDGYNPCASIDFIDADAHYIGSSLKESFDLIVSNGLNIYEKNESDEIDLYLNLFSSLRKSGTLIISFLTPPPSLNKESPWKTLDKDGEAIMNIFCDKILKVEWRNYNMEDEIKYKLKKAGFKHIETIFDQQNMFPTIVSSKS